ncbi:hypothetical protein [Zavarzinia sp. CC-PAN008]|uniref:hypothetical protein n=1 Tax=Zavarzinia sp. CC-PAN008 TaxID=3243332 RepID=UPI003F745C1E
MTNIDTLEAQARAGDLDAWRRWLTAIAESGRSLDDNDLVDLLSDVESAVGEAHIERVAAEQPFVAFLVANAGGHTLSRPEDMVADYLRRRLDLRPDVRAFLELDASHPWPGEGYMHKA